MMEMIQASIFDFFAMAKDASSALAESFSQAIKVFAPIWPWETCQCIFWLEFCLTNGLVLWERTFLE
ncbi:MAG: hypothetical protein KJ950_00405 [Proteobacteria bacterium]|nr:hypothetical protein [Pseudomonadota bacterium]MBU1685814.1 hypothetical protein [Pseudomonadota bacterium]